MTTWTRTTSGYCEAGGWTHHRRARWQGPPTPTGGDLWCGTCKREYEHMQHLRRLSRAASSPCMNAPGWIEAAREEPS